MTHRKQDYFVAEIVEFTLPGARKFRFIRTPGMTIAKRIYLLINGLLKFHYQKTGEENKVTLTSSAWLGIDKNATSNTQLMHSIIMSYGVIGSVKQSTLIAKALETAKFNFETYKEIPDFKEYIDSLVELKAIPLSQIVVAAPFMGNDLPAEAGYDVYMRLTKINCFISTSVLVTTNLTMEGLTDYKTKEIDDIAHIALWQLLYFKIGLDVSMLFNTLSSRYYLTQSGLMGNRISFNDGYFRAVCMKNRIDAVLNSWANMEVNKDYEVVALSKTLNKHTIVTTPTSKVSAGVYDYFCQHRKQVESASLKVIAAYAGYKK